MVIQADTVTGAGCVLSSQFSPVEEIVWRIRIIDTGTGEAMDGDSLQSVTVKISDGSEFPAHFGEHPPQDPVDTYWTSAWIVPDDYPTGSFSYTITATDKDGNTATFVPFLAPTSQLTIVASQ